MTEYPTTQILQAYNALAGLKLQVKDTVTAVGCSVDVDEMKSTTC